MWSEKRRCKCWREIARTTLQTVTGHWKGLIYQFYIFVVHFNCFSKQDETNVPWLLSGNEFYFLSHRKLKFLKSDHLVQLTYWDSDLFSFLHLGGIEIKICLRIRILVMEALQNVPLYLQAQHSSTITLPTISVLKIPHLSHSPSYFIANSHFVGSVQIWFYRFQTYP